MRRRTPTLLAVTVAVLASSFRSGPVAGATRTARPARADGELVIGSLAPETGAQSPLLDSLRVPVKLAVDEINAAGALNGVPVRLVTGDEGADSGVAHRSFDRLARSDHADAVIGPSSSGSALALVGAIGARRVLTCSGSDTAAPVRPDDSLGFYFRTAPPDRLQGVALADLVLADGHRRVAVLARGDFYGTTIVRPLVRHLRRGGARIVAQVAYDPKGGGAKAEVRAVVKAKPTAVVVVGFPLDAAPIVHEMIIRGIGPKNVAVFAPDGLQSNGFAALVDSTDPSAIAGIKGTAPAAAPANIPSPFNYAFAVTSVPPIFSAYYYDCTILTALAAIRAKSDDASKLKRAFAVNLEGRQDCNTFAQCKQLLESGATIHWRGASSNFDHFDRFEPGEGTYDLWSYDAEGHVVTADPAQQIHVP